MRRLTTPNRTSARVAAEAGPLAREEGGPMAASLDLLRRLVAPPGAGVDRDWDSAAAQEGLGLPLPQDYIRLVDVYGAGEFDDPLALVVPAPTRNGNEFVRYDKPHMDNLTDL